MSCLFIRKCWVLPFVTVKTRRFVILDRNCPKKSIKALESSKFPNLRRFGPNFGRFVFEEMMSLSTNTTVLYIVYQVQSDKKAEECVV
jgi:hypothetical protein